MSASPLSAIERGRKARILFAQGSNIPHLVSAVHLHQNLWILLPVQFSHRQFSSMQSTSVITCFCYRINVYQKSCKRFLYPFCSTINPAIFARTNNEMRTTFSVLVNLLDLMVFILFFYYGKGSLATISRVGLQAIKYCISIFIY